MTRVFEVTNGCQYKLDCTDLRNLASLSTTGLTAGCQLQYITLIVYGISHAYLQRGGGLTADHAAVLMRFEKRDQ